MIQRRVREMGAQISKDYKGQRVHLIGVLKGAAIFLSDLIRQVKVEVSWISCPSQVMAMAARVPARCA